MFECGLGRPLASADGLPDAWITHESALVANMLAADGRPYCHPVATTMLPPGEGDPRSASSAAVIGRSPCGPRSSSGSTHSVAVTILPTSAALAALVALAMAARATPR